MTKRKSKVRATVAIIPPRMTKQERDWMAEDDLRALTRADEIRNDPKRMAAVKKVSKRVLSEKQKEVQSIQKVASPKRKPAKKRK